MPRQSPFHIALGSEDRAVLEALARRYTSPYREVIRAKIVLYAARGLRNDEIAQRPDTPRQFFCKWRKRSWLCETSYNAAGHRCWSCTS